MIFSFQNASFRDQATGLYNQAYFMEVFNREWHRLIRDKKALSILIVDPHLTKFSPSVTEELQRIAQVLENQTLRSTDITCRFSENVFAMGLFSLDEKGTEVIIKRIVEELNTLEIQGGFHCNLSIGGVNVLPDISIDLNDVFKQSFDALQQAESSGKNGFIVQHYIH
jgi:diguanylate cyclase (GGDEF)-like protein